MTTTETKNGIGNLLDKFLREAPGNETLEKVHGFMRGVLFKYTIFVAYLGSHKRKQESEDQCISDAELTTWLNKCINALLAGDDEQNKETLPFLQTLQL